MVGGLSHASGSYTTPQGRVEVSWTAAGDGPGGLAATVPANTTAEIWVPTAGRKTTAPLGAKFARFDSSGGVQYAVYSVVSGTYRFDRGR
jgi:alpha-L-rhamnosidase